MRRGQQLAGRLLAQHVVARGRVQEIGGIGLPTFELANLERAAEILERVRPDNARAQRDRSRGRCESRWSGCGRWRCSCPCVSVARAMRHDEFVRAASFLQPRAICTRSSCVVPAPFFTNRTETTSTKLSGYAFLRHWESPVRDTERGAGYQVEQLPNLLRRRDLAVVIAPRERRQVQVQPLPPDAAFGAQLALHVRPEALRSGRTAGAPRPIRTADTDGRDGPPPCIARDGAAGMRGRASRCAAIAPVARPPPAAPPPPTRVQSKHEGRSALA